MGSPFHQVSKTKNELLELTIIKRELIDEINQLNEQNNSSQIHSKSKLTGKDFEDFTKEELMNFLAKAREEIIVLRQLLNRYKY